MSHIAVDVREDGVTSPRRHEETEGEGKGEPVRREKVGLCWLAQGARGVRLDEPIDEDDYNN